MVRSRVGYAGGTTKNPTYYKIGDHTESFQLEYDPEKISYEKLLKLFWATHNPCEDAKSRQYMSAIFYHNDEQRKLAEQTRDAEEKRRGEKIKTPVLPFDAFYLAEDYHQKFYLKQNKDVYQEYRNIYPGDEEFMNSTAVMRVNGYLGGSGSAFGLQKEVDSYGLTPASREKLYKLVKGVK